MRAILLAGFAALSLAACNTGGSGAGAGGGTGTAMPAGGTGMSSLINVNLSNIRAEIAKNVNVALEDVPITIQLPVTVAANVCGVNVNLLSVQVNRGSNPCTATTSSVELEQAVRNEIS